MRFKEERNRDDEPMNVIWNYDENGDPSTSTAVPIGFRVVVIGNDVRISHASATLWAHVSRIIRNFHWTLLLLLGRRSQPQNDAEASDGDANDDASCFGCGGGGGGDYDDNGLLLQAGEEICVLVAVVVVGLG